MLDRRRTRLQVTYHQSPSMPLQCLGPGAGLEIPQSGIQRSSAPVPKPFRYILVSSRVCASRLLVLLEEVPARQGIVYISYRLSLPPPLYAQPSCIVNNTSKQHHRTLFKFIPMIHLGFSVQNGYKGQRETLLLPVEQISVQGKQYRKESLGRSLRLSFPPPVSVQTPWVLTPCTFSSSFRAQRSR